MPGAFRLPEEVLALAVSGDRPSTRVVEAVPAFLAWNTWNSLLLRAFAKSQDRRAASRLAWLADIAITIDDSRGFPGGCLGRQSLEAFIKRIPVPKKADSLGYVDKTGRLSPVSKRWNITYPASLEVFRLRAQALHDSKDQSQEKAKVELQ